MKLEDRIERLEGGKGEDALERIKKNRATPEYKRLVEYIKTLSVGDRAMFRRELLDKIYGPRLH